MRMVMCRAAAFAMAVLISGPVAAQALEDILAPRPGTAACWQRTYSDKHLAKHPRQKVTQIRFGLSYYERDHHRAGKGEYAFSVDIATRERSGSEGGLCHTDGKGKAICAVECDGGAMQVRQSGPDGSILVELLSGGVRLEGCESDEAFWMSAKPDDRAFLLHPAACSDDASALEATE